MTTLRIGKPRKTNRGVTLIEVMIAVAILSLGTLIISESNMNSMNVYGRYANLVMIHDWADQKIWEAKEEIFESEIPNTGSNAGTVTRQGRNYNWRQEVSSKDKENELYTVSLTVEWEERGRTMNTSRYGFLFKPKL